jgi:uncharacterized protein YegJ (DUF2314 family)
MSHNLRPLFAIALAASSLSSLARDVIPYNDAQQHLHYFNEALAAQGSAQFRILVEVRQGTKREQFWLSKVRREGVGYVGRLETIPQQLSSVHLGQDLHVQSTDVLDWTYQDGATRTIYGHFNTCAEFKVLPTEEAAEQMAYWNIACKPSK